MCDCKNIKFGESKIPFNGMEKNCLYANLFDGRLVVGYYLFDPSLENYVSSCCTITNFNYCPNCGEKLCD